MRIVISAIVMISSLLVALAAAACELVAVPDSQLAAVLKGKGVIASSTAVVFRSSLERDEDGAPHAYHRGLADASPDPGLDHICNGGDVLEQKGDKLINKYRDGGSIGALDGIDPATGVKRSLLCKRDYISIRDAGFPACGPGHLCMRWYGVDVEPRSCGYNRKDQMGCGVPRLQKSEDGSDTDYYISTNQLRRPGAHSPFVQSDFADATRVPFLVTPGGLNSIAGNALKTGDLVVVVWGGRVAYGVIGDSGPPGQIGEASKALLAQLGAKAVAATHPSTTIIFPNTKARIMNHWPLDSRKIEAEARKLIAENGGVEALKTCAGLETLR